MIYYFHINKINIIIGPTRILHVCVFGCILFMGLYVIYMEPRVGYYVDGISYNSYLGLEAHLCIDYIYIYIYCVSVMCKSDRVSLSTNGFTSYSPHLCTL